MPAFVGIASIGTVNILYRAAVSTLITARNAMRSDLCVLDVLQNWH